MEVTSDGLARFVEVVLPHLNEVRRRVVAGASAEMLGRGEKSNGPGTSKWNRIESARVVGFAGAFALVAQSPALSWTG